MERKAADQALINNDFYDHLKDGWYHESNHPVALLRAENQIRNPWIINTINTRIRTFAKVLDVGCGAGFLCNPLAINGHDVTGIDLSKESLLTAERFDETKKVKYLYGNALDLPFEDSSFDVVCAMDILEHVDDPKKLIQEASRVLKEKGLFFFHTFNKNFLSYLMVIKGVEWFVENTPKNMHVYHLFLTPEKVSSLCKMVHLQVDTLLGLRPKFHLPFIKMIFTKKVPSDFSFVFSKSLLTGYCGIAKKNSSSDCG